MPSTENQQPLDIAAERAKCTFDPASLTPLFYGGEEKMRQLKNIEAMIDSDPVFDRSDRYFLGRTERFKRALPMVKRYVELRNENGFTPEESAYFKTYVDDYIPVHLHESMFLPVLRAQASEEQLKKWGPSAENFHYIGCYAQTELGHGSALSRLETTATLDTERDEWVINSPTQSSAKFWIGTLGKVANHAVVQAKLIINGKDYGAHPFLVPLRSLKDHSLLPGVVIKDQGPKQGAISMDNGYARFNNVCIPRENMLMRFSQVSREGVYSKPIHPKLAYGGMTAVRTTLINHSALSMARGATIAIRYCAVRRQGNVNVATDLETQVLDYPAVQYRVLPLLSHAFATIFSGYWMNEMYAQYNANISKGDTSLLKDVHVYSSGLKSYCTKLGADGIEEARRCLGGHGYSLFSGMIDFHRQFLATVTYEGENALLTQQVSRYLLKLYKDAVRDPKLKLSPPSKYILSLADHGAFVQQRCQARSADDLYRADVVLAAFQHRAARLIYELAQAEKAGHAWSDLNLECMRLSKAHVQYIMIENFYNGLEKRYNASSNPTHEQQNQLAAVRSVYHLHVFYTMETELSEFLEDSYFNPEQAAWVRQGVKDCLKAVRPNAVGFSDCFGFTDTFLNSALGSFDGRAYERMAEMTEREPLNSKEMSNEKGVIWGYEQYLKPLIDGKAGPYKGRGASKL
ncbi:acyl-CoA dehydrogenase/oxidase [Gamsiella multidivaricata]|uniref:acyl-CoA dehydrogenase/oxidase n=1 Tax=Gamsiella multidivaricata TaxID=101098 RepID=UPI00221F2369|nr:acyl-CoA dehydrogenase/oxidase [Gamsiella multidivaricata]KAI7821385.1 acyl-CoA dehydrogenase/oxidase [Gamsiella multidivaricata]